MGEHGVKERIVWYKLNSFSTLRRDQYLRNTGVSVKERDVREGGETQKQQCWNWFRSVSKRNAELVGLYTVTKIWVQTLKGSSPLVHTPGLQRSISPLCTAGTEAEHTVMTELTAPRDDRSRSREIKERLGWQVVWGHRICQKRWDGVDLQHIQQQNQWALSHTASMGGEGKTLTRSVKGSKMNSSVPRGGEGEHISKELSAKLPESSPKDWSTLIGANKEHVYYKLGSQRENTINPLKCFRAHAIKISSQVSNGVASYINVD